MITLNRFLLFLIMSIVVGTSSCSVKEPSKYDIIKQNAEEKIKSIMNDPDSYEFNKLEIIDSFLYRDNIKYRRDYFTENLSEVLKDIEEEEYYKVKFPSIFNEMKYNSLLEDKEKQLKINKIVLPKIDSLETLLGNKVNDVASYTCIFSFRGNNLLGAKALTHYYLQTSPSPDFKITNLTTDEDELFLNPNDFPGYREMLSEYYNKHGF